ncbi:hypothetical protein VNI00_002903 [Paramarasmius palmivorus]|uniref:Uncharacterized protein n=1 Tax=Paramarasmius palmivorus TaxID=297713 RepID=A0AAW0DZA0_9AGAR
MEKYFSRPFSLDQPGWYAINPPRGLYQFWKQCWGTDQPQELLTHADLAPKCMSMPVNDLPSTSTSIQLCPASILRLQRALLREEYKLLYERLNNHDFQGWKFRQAILVITGHPGIEPFYDYYEPEPPSERILRCIRDEMLGLPPQEDWEMVYILPYQTDMSIPYVEGLEKVPHLSCCFPLDAQMRRQKVFQVVGK